jgi:hypothetical protein
MEYRAPDDCPCAESQIGAMPSLALTLDDHPGSTAAEQLTISQG